MRVSVVLLFCFMLSAMVFPQKQAGKVVLDTDSIPFPDYHVGNMSLFLNDTLIHYSVVFDVQTGFLKEEYMRLHGTTDHYKAVKNYGEKYREGILVYQKRGELKDEE